MSGQQHAPAAFYPRERPGTHCAEGWVGPQGRSGRAENPVPTGDFFLIHPYLLHYYCYIPVHNSIQPSTHQADRTAVIDLSVTISQFLTPHHYTHTEVFVAVCVTVTLRAGHCYL